MKLHLVSSQVLGRLCVAKFLQVNCLQSLELSTAPVQQGHVCQYLPLIYCLLFAVCKVSNFVVPTPVSKGDMRPDLIREFSKWLSRGSSRERSMRRACLLWWPRSLLSGGWWALWIPREEACLRAALDWISPISATFTEVGQFFLLVGRCLTALLSIAFKGQW